MANSRDTILNLFPDNNNNEITASKIRQFVTAVFNEEIDINEIQDRLTSTDNDKPLSANQGRILDGKITTVSDSVDGKEPSLPNGNADEVLTLDINGDKLWKAPIVYNETTVYDGLDSIDPALALSAKQGNILDGKITSQDNINTAQDGQIALITTDVGELDARVTQNELDILSNTGEIVATNARVDANIVSINNNNNAITTNTTNIGTNTTNIATNVTDIASVNARVDATDILVGTNTTNIGTLTTSVNTNTTDIATLQGQVGAIDVVNLDGRVTANSSLISVLDARVTGQDGLINANTTSITANTGSISANTATISALDTRVGTNETDITTLQASDVTIQASIDTLDSRVTVNEGDILTNQGSISTLIINVQSNTDDINTNTVAISNNASSVTALTSTVDGNSVNISQNTSDIANNSALIENNRVDIVRLDTDIGNTDTALAQLSVVVNDKENALGLPVTNGQVLSSLTDGTRSWIDAGTGGTGGETVIVDNLDSIGDATSALSANMGYVLDQKVADKEDDLGFPYKDNMILTSLSNGSRAWQEANILTVDYGFFYGAGDPILSITVLPADNTYYASLIPIQYTATAYRSASDTDVTTSSDWASSATSIATVSTTGVVTPVGNSYGTATISATLDGIIGTTTITVEQVLIISVLLTPADDTQGQNVEIQYTATATYNDGSTSDVTALSQWTGSNSAIASVNNTSPDKGKVVTNNTGTTGIVTINNVIDDGTGTNDIASSTTLTVTL